MFKKIKEAIQKKKLYNTTHNELCRMSDRELADIGIHRSEIGRVSYESAFGGQ
jgi:uncharacterized protein YjiS (DUF1127 family)